MAAHAAPPPQTLALREGDTVGKYMIVRLLGQGATANVYLATNSEEGRFVALKAMRPELSGQTVVRDMFLFEARLLTQFEHPNIVRAREVGEIGRDPFLVLEYLDGAPMHQILAATVERGGRIPFPVIATLMEGALSGLEHVHTETNLRKGAVHCDISPYNLFATYEGEAKLIDFGIARVGTKAQRSPDVRGRYAYMAPEQALMRPFDHRADLFSMGVVLWELTTGQRLFRRGDDEATKQAMLTMRVPHLSEMVPEVPEGLDDLVMLALQRDPAQRASSARQMHDLLVQIAEQAGGMADPSEVAHFCASITGGSLLTPGVPSMANPGRGRSFSLPTPPPMLPVFSSNESGFGDYLRQTFADLPPAFQDPRNQAPAEGANILVSGISGIPMFEDEFTMRPDGVMALRSSVPETPAHAIQPSGAIHMVAAEPKSSRGIWFAAVAALAIGGGLLAWFMQGESYAFDDGEPAGLPITSATDEGETIELDPLPGEIAAPLGGGVGSGNALSPAGTPPSDTVIEMADGYLDVLADPPASVFIDGKSIGKTPLKAYPVPAGNHVVQLIRNGKTLHLNMEEIPEGRIKVIDVRDKPLEAPAPSAGPPIEL